MKRFKSLTNRSGLFGAILTFMAAMFGVSSCTPDFDLDKRFPEWLGTSIYETLKEGFKNDSTGEFYTFNNFVRLIEDLDQVNILAKTGSKTLFVADDKAFERFFQNCPFYDGNGNKVTSYDQLSKAQKTMILNGSMLNNVYQVAMLSSSPGGSNSAPLLGNCMRRVSASTILDTIPVMKPSQMPVNNKYWDRLRNKSDKGIAILQDGTNKPIIFFVNKFLQYNRIDNDDYDFLFRLGPTYSKVGKPKHNPGDASVNGAAIAWPNKKCFNGFLHVMSEVVYLLPNMADYIASNPNTRIYSSILDRFSVPYYEGSEKANRDENIRYLISKAHAYPIGGDLDQALAANDDSVFIKKYLARRVRVGNNSGNSKVSQNTNLDRLDPISNEAELLKFDPGWNSFISSTTGNNTDVALQQDMGLMFVPYDDALMEWWLDESQVGARLRARYGLEKYKGRNDLTVDEVIEDMGGVELKTILELVNVNMQTSLVSSVPSKFSSVLNDAQDPFFENRSRAEAEATIDDVVMCCNGAVYFTNIVYVPTAYRSVSYPVLVNEKLQIIDWAIKDETLAFKAYLNSMVAEYSFFVPLIDTVNGSAFENKLVWIDPASFYLDKEGGKMKALALSYAPNTQSSYQVIADLYDYDPTTGLFTAVNKRLVPEPTSSDDVPTKFIRNRLLDIMDYHIIIGDVEESTSKDLDGYSYFRTKGRGTIRFKNTGAFGDIATMDVQGGWQKENEGQPDAIQRPVKIVQRVDLSKKTSLTPGNGRTYIIDRPLLPSRKSVYDIVSDTLTYPEFTSFFKLMNVSGLFEKTSNTNQIGSKYCISTFNTYHYTVYVPKNAGVDALLASKKIMLPSELTAIDDQFDQNKLILQAIYNGDPKKDSLVNAAFRDSLFALSIRLFGYADTAGVEIAMAKRKTGANKETDEEYNKRRDSYYFTNKKLDQLKNFVKYHIQDNSVYVGADFNPGVDDRTGLPAEKAEYETAFMNANQQFVKMTVKGGDDITINDKNGHTRTVQKLPANNGKQYYNIMCREYEVKPFTSGNSLSEATYSTGEFSIETSSYAVVHLIDEPLCNGDLIF